MQELIELLRVDVGLLESEFHKASIQGKGTSQEVADFRENAVQSFVERFFPFPHRITKGKLRDSFGSVSDSIDCVICNPIHPYTTDSRGKFQLILADGVDVAIEVKPDVAQKSELERGLAQGLSVKNLRRAAPPTLSKSPFDREHALRVPYFIFAMRAKSDPLSTGKEIIEFYKSRAIPAIDQADAIVVNNCGLFFNFKDQSQFTWVTDIPAHEKKGWYFENWKEDTLAGFLFRLHSIPHAEIKMAEDVLPRYFRNLRVKGITRVGGNE